MILENRKGQELVKSLARPIVAQLAPDEIEDFDDLAEDFFDDPRLEGDHTLGSAFALLPDLVVILMFVAATLEHLLARNGSAPPKILLERLAKAMVHGQEVEGIPQFSPRELPPAFESASQKTRSLPAHTQERIQKMLEKLLPVQVGILYLGANPETGTPLRVDHELRQISAAIRESPLRDRILLSSDLAVTADDLHRSLLANRPHVVHFSGHGTQTNAILIEKESGAPRSIPADSLLKLLQVFKDGLRLVVLNACYSEGQAVAIAAYVDAVIGMSEAISDDAAMSFSRGFYRALAHGEHLQRSFDLGCSQIDLDGFHSEAGIPRLFVLREDPRDIVLVEAAAEILAS
jgi:CHAT domain-containing protein